MGVQEIGFIAGAIVVLIVVGSVVAWVKGRTAGRANKTPS